MLPVCRFLATQKGMERRIMRNNTSRDMERYFGRIVDSFNSRDSKGLEGLLESPDDSANGKLRVVRNTK